LYLIIYKCYKKSLYSGYISHTDKISQKRDLTPTEKSKIIKCPWEGCCS